MYLTTYLINENRHEFYNRIMRNIDAFNNHIEYKNESDDNLEYNVVEGNLFGEEIVIYFEGEISIIKVFIKYSHFINYEEFYNRIVVFEKKLMDLFSDLNSFYRVDEILFDDLLIENGESWYIKENAFEIFNEFIVHQEKGHWRKIESPYLSISHSEYIESNFES